MNSPSSFQDVSGRRFRRTWLSLCVVSIALLGLGITVAPSAEARGKPKPTAPPTEPGPRIWHAMSGDGSDEQHGVYVFGGTRLDTDGNSIILGDFWFYDLAGPTWQYIEPTGKTRPAGRQHASFSCGPTECVLAHGYPRRAKGGGTDTWRFDKATGSWSALNCSVSFCPGARSNAAFGFDSSRKMHLLFGGGQSGPDGLLGDTYTFADGRWTQQFPAHAPSPREMAAMAYVPPLGSVVLYGGEPYSDPPSGCDLWAWNGTDWQSIAQLNQGPCLVAHSMAWDTRATPPRLLVTGGYRRQTNDWTRNTSAWTFEFEPGSNAGRWSELQPTSLSCSYDQAYTGDGAPFFPESKMAADGDPSDKVFFGGIDDSSGSEVVTAGLIICD